ncbi:MAG: phosphate ABC transporter permease PstA, partial [Verrucomicrobiota bacterium]
STDLALLANDQGRLAVEKLAQGEIEAILPAKGTLFVRTQNGQRFAVCPQYLRLKGRDISVSETDFSDQFAEALIQASDTRSRILELQRGASLVESTDEKRALFNEVQTLRDSSQKNVLIAEGGRGSRIEIEVMQISEYYFSDELSFQRRVGIYFDRIFSYVTDYPLGGTTSGGVFPAIVGTFFLTLIMSVIVAPLGVVVALYLSEYARNGLLLSWVRIAVNNLAGIPSIIYGVFGLGFFVYFVGGRVDQFLFAENLPSPTYGTGGILWASLSLALMTLPVVIVSTEQSLRSVPRHIRDASMALGASKWQTIWRVVLPYATPGLLTGLILAVARAAGEVAPLMLLGVTRLAPQILLSAEAPFIHFERKFMHLGYHVYDLTFHSSNSIEAVPFLFKTALLLVGLIFLMNFSAVIARRLLMEQQRKLGGN